LTGEADDEEALVDVDGPPVLKPWSYQTEMLQESLRRNVIVAVSFLSRVWVLWELIEVDGRWILGRGKHMCE